MKDFLTKRVSINHHQLSTNSNPALEVANQLRNELYEKLNKFPSKKSSRSNDKCIFSFIPPSSNGKTN
jgi:hypothetical protein